MAAHKFSNLDPRVDRPAVVDEWGIYDPSQAGLEVAFERVAAKRRAASSVDVSNLASSMRDANRLTDAAKKPDSL
jgi:hypothetical protein